MWSIWSMWSVWSVWSVPKNMLRTVAVWPVTTFVVSDEKNDVVAVGGAVGIRPIGVKRS